ncbi:MAG: PLP-dependent aminotransferase family protein, partial [Spirochaetaceae bacterium]|nr:PLP-dependent aminotransferase family protein [Spirochaetaceae bacterium]
VAALRAAAAEALDRDGARALTYNFSPGYPPLREAVARRHAAEAREVFLANGSIELLNFAAAALLGPGKRAFVESPSYDRAVALFRRSGAEVVGIPMEADGPDLEALEAALADGPPALFYTIADFHNPAGVVASEVKRRAVADRARALGFLVVEDSPYRPLRYEGAAPPAYRDLAPELTLQVHSVSKLLAPGLRVSWALGPAPLVESLVRLGLERSMAPASFSQATAAVAIESGLLDRNIEALKALYRPRLQSLKASFAARLPGVAFPPAEGGFFIGATLPEGNRMDRLLARAAEAGLRLTDGRAFFLDPAAGERFLRVPFCSLRPDEIAEAARRLAGLVDNLG